MFTGRAPFAATPDLSVTLTILKGLRPQKPDPIRIAGLTPAVWKIAQECWHKRAARRPGTVNILERLEAIAGSGVETVTPFARLLSKPSGRQGSVGDSLLSQSFNSMLRNITARFTGKPSQAGQQETRRSSTPPSPVPSAQAREREIKRQIDLMDKESRPHFHPP